MQVGRYRWLLLLQATCPRCYANQARIVKDPGLICVCVTPVIKLKEHSMRNPDPVRYSTAVAAAGLAVFIPAGMALAQAGSAPVPAQAAAPSEEVALTPQQQAEFDRWPPIMQTTYRSWPRETKAYYWSLEAEQQQIFWRLRQRDKIALTAMTGPERDAAWNQIAEEIAASAKE